MVADLAGYGSNPGASARVIYNVIRQEINYENRNILDFWGTSKSVFRDHYISLISVFKPDKWGYRNRVGYSDTFESRFPIVLITCRIYNIYEKIVRQLD